MLTEGMLMRCRQTVSISPPSLMPNIDNLVPFEKVDVLISFSEEHPEVRSAINAVLKKNPTMTLAQTDDLSVGQTSHFAVVEVKNPDGGYSTSSLQLATWLAAGLEKMRLLKELADKNTGREHDDKELLMPFVGISVVGHAWYVHVAAKAKDGNVVRIPSVFCFSKQQSSNQMRWWE